MQAEGGLVTFEFMSGPNTLHQGWSPTQDYSWTSDARLSPRLFFE